MNQNSDKVSVIIVTYNSLPALSQALASLKQADGSDQLELIVVDNHSTDNSLEEVLLKFPQAIIIKNSCNNGFAAACNQGAKAASGRYLLFFNPDLEIDPDAVTVLKEFIDKDEKIGAVAGRMRFPGGAFQATCRMFPTYKNIFFSRGSVLGRIIKSDIVYTLPDYEEATAVEAVAGTFLMIKKELFEKVGRFDERFFMYMEDTDLSYKLRQAGYRNYFVPQSGGVHLWGEGSSGGELKRGLYHHRSVWKYFLKYFPNGFSLLILPLLLLINLIVGLLIPKPRKQ